MEKKQGFFSALRDEVIRSFTPSRSRPRSRSASPSRSNSHMKALLWGRKKLLASSGCSRGGGAGGYHLASQPEPLIGRSESLRPVIEGPDPDNDETQTDSKRIGSGLGHWVKGQMSRAPSVASTRSDLRLLLGVLGAPLAPIKVSSSLRDSPIVKSLNITFRFSSVFSPGLGFDDLKNTYLRFDDWFDSCRKLQLRSTFCNSTRRLQAARSYKAPSKTLMLMVRSR